MTIRPWHPNEPLADDNLSDSQPKLQDNTNTIQAILSKTMVPFDDPNAGLFKQIDLKNITSLPPRVEGFGGLYILNGKLVFRNPNGETTNIPLEITTLDQGWVNIGGFIIQLGVASLKRGVSTKITFPRPFPIECRLPVLTPVIGGLTYPVVKLLRWQSDFLEASAFLDTNITWVAFGR